MNCCDEFGNCRQGRDCPARVAKVKARYPRTPECVPPSLWRDYLRQLTRWLVFSAALGLVCAAVLFLVVH